MVMVHPGRATPLAAGPRLLLEVSGEGSSHASLTLEAPDGLTLRRRLRSWVVEGSVGTTGTVSVAADDGGLMAETMTVTVSLPGATPPVLTRWELGDVLVDRRSRVDLFTVTRRDDDVWQITSLIPDRTGPGPVVRPPGPVLGEPVTLDVAIAIDQSASLRWLVAGSALSAIVSGLEWARTHALTASSTVSWLAYGSGRDGADGVTPLPQPGPDAQDLLDALHALPATSGARLDVVAAAHGGADVLVAITDSWPEPELVQTCSAAGTALAVVLAGMPADRRSWPADWHAAEERCTGTGVFTLPVGAGSDGENAVRDWCLGMLATLSDRDAREALR